MLKTIPIDMVESQEFKVSLTTAFTFTAVGPQYFLLQLSVILLGPLYANFPVGVSVLFASTPTSVWISSYIGTVANAWSAFP